MDNAAAIANNENRASSGIASCSSLHAPPFGAARAKSDDQQCPRGVHDSLEKRTGEGAVSPILNEGCSDCVLERALERVPLQKTKLYFRGTGFVTATVASECLGLGQCGVHYPQNGIDEGSLICFFVLLRNAAMRRSYAPGLKRSETDFRGGKDNLFLIGVLNRTGC